MDLEAGTYSVDSLNWYKARPYGFKFTDKNGKSTAMFLPISPSNLTITTDFATNIITTLYGTVEEHSEVRYYDIVIEGTTGATPKYVNPAPLTKMNKPNRLSVKGRGVFVKSAMDISAGGVFKKTVDTVNDVRKKLSNISFTSLDDTEVIRESGVATSETGYMAFHNLYRFLLQYKKDAAGLNGNKKEGAEAKAPLIFFNYKDSNQYNVAVRSFVLRRSAENPTLYYYQIVMRGYALSSLDIPEIKFKSLEKNLGLGGLNSGNTLYKIMKKANKIRALLASVAMGARQAGR